MAPSCDQGPNLEVKEGWVEPGLPVPACTGVHSCEKQPDETTGGKGEEDNRKWLADHDTESCDQHPDITTGENDEEDNRKFCSAPQSAASDLIDLTITCRGQFVCGSTQSQTWTDPSEAADSSVLGRSGCQTWVVMKMGAEPSPCCEETEWPACWNSGEASCSSALHPAVSYKDLHVYQLEHPTQIIEWTSGKTVCVAGYSTGKNEILELRLPLKLLADEKKGLCAERDFKVVHGGFSEGPVCCLRHIPGTRCAVTNDGLRSDLQLWDLGADDTDVIRKTGSLPGTSVSQSGSRIAARLSSSPQVLHGAQSSGVQLTQLSTGQTLYRLEVDSTEPLSSLKFVSETAFLASCCDGTVYLADIRTSAPPQASPPPGECALWWTDASAAPQCRVIRLSSSGQAVVSDLRNMGGAVYRAQLDVQTSPRQPEDVTVAWAPALDGCFSVSDEGSQPNIAGLRMRQQPNVQTDYRTVPIWRKEQQLSWPDVDTGRRCRSFTTELVFHFIQQLIQVIVIHDKLFVFALLASGPDQRSQASFHRRSQRSPLLEKVVVRGFHLVVREVLP
ncbi:hypothetical protein CCH79_00015453 [Gambusia affinis]|uniref:Uncharacterized protein n=1 Tax=Gambusia affinis TaxID=33528 RepID=A0A315VPE1_GAMAF|nr:hypothetical protein CCH79_00015453 [Gambusia affinis]